MSRIRKGYAASRFGQVHYRQVNPETDSGKRPLLCFHMSPYSSIIYERWIEEMGRDRTVIAFDTPGFGESDPTPDLPTIADYAHAMMDVLDDLGLPSADLMGYHTGSKIAVEMALQSPQRIHRVVMVSAPLWTEEELREVKALYGPEALTDDGAHLARWWQSAVR